MEKDAKALISLLQAISKQPQLSPAKLSKLIKQYHQGDRLFKKSSILKGFSTFKHLSGIKPLSRHLKALLTVKPTRSLSGITPLTVLTKPYPCPGKCIFCPADIRMPKSYLSYEPGAQRAAHHLFDPFLQTHHRLKALVAMGHPVAKIELLVLGGTWSAYPLSYRLWFLTRVFDALNQFNPQHPADLPQQPKNGLNLPPLFSRGQEASFYQHTLSGQSYNQAYQRYYATQTHLHPQTATWKDLSLTQRANESAAVRCVGLVLETRPDCLTPTEIHRLRHFGATKIQVGVQSLQNRVLKLNHRQQTVAATGQAISLLRSVGFKLHLHWMPNLYGSTPNQDRSDYLRLFSRLDYRPDEVKIYPCSLIAGTPLVSHFKAGSWQPYSSSQLKSLLSFCLIKTPRYCRISRVVRDIPAADILVGNKQTNFRQIAETNLPQKLVEIRAREIRRRPFQLSNLSLKTTSYQTLSSLETFLEWITPEDYLVGFLRLSFPPSNSVLPKMFCEIQNSAIIREVHVYGQTLTLGTQSSTASQHLGLGKKLINRAIDLSREKGYRDLAVISAVGTRPYYRQLGFADGQLYQHYEL